MASSRDGRDRHQPDGHDKPSAAASSVASSSSSSSAPASARPAASPASPAVATPPAASGPAAAPPARPCTPSLQAVQSIDPAAAQQTTAAAARLDSSHADAPLPEAPAPAPAPAPLDPANANEQTLQADHMVPATPFAAAPMANLDQRAYVMMALASMSAAPPAMSPPPTVTPSQVTLPSLAHSGLVAPNSLRQAAADKGLESFASIEFADSVFQMTTYAVIIGRDQRALQQARRDEKRADQHKRRVEENASKGLPPLSPIQNDRSKFSKSYVSEEGGMLGPESDSEDNTRPAKRRKTSTAGSSQNDNDDNIISNRQYVSHTPGAAAVDLTSLRPSPYHVPFIGIHSPGPNTASKTKAISREHLKIAYNQQDGVFEAIPLHKNGFFCDDVHYKSDKVVLRCGHRLQIKDIGFRFIINGVERGRTGAEEFIEEEAAKQRQAHGGKEMSFDFEQSHGAGQIQDTSDELSDLEVSPPELSDLGEDFDGEEAGAPDGEEKGKGKARVQVDKAEPEPALEPEPAVPQVPKKRGPGRPPKNGIMSKREQRLLKKQQQEMAKKTVPQPPPPELLVKRKVGRPRKHPLPENAADRPEKRKYKPRKPKNEDGAEGSDAERRAREKKEKKARPKSPPLELKMEDYSAEQLLKPNKNYGVLIDEALTAAGPDGLTLKQIYKRISQRYPWFYFHTETKGWESSVRHNLIGNEAFKKDETTNLWSRVPGVELDAGKKRKAPSPDRVLPAQGYAPYPYPLNAVQHVHAAGHPGGFVGGQAAPAGFQVHGLAGQPGAVTRPVQPHGSSVCPAGQAQANRAPGLPHAPGYGPPPAPAQAQLGAPQPGAYSSPYASRPPPVVHGPVKTEDGVPAALPPPPPAVPPSAMAPSAAAQPSPATALASPWANAGAGPAQAAHPAPGPAGRPSVTPPAGAPPRPVIDPRLLSAIVNLKNGLVDNLTKARNPKAEAIVMSALNRCIGLKKETENDKMESICIKGIRQVIDGFLKNTSPAPGGSTPSDAPLPVLEPRVLFSLNGFKDVSVKALEERLGVAKAEAVTLSAIDRVLGLADATIVPAPCEGEQEVNLEGVEQRLIKTIRQLLVGMSQKLQDLRQ